MKFHYSWDFIRQKKVVDLKGSQYPFLPTLLLLGRGLFGIMGLCRKRIG